MSKFNVGDKVKWGNKSLIGAGTGVVISIYPEHLFTDDDGLQRIPEAITVLVDRMPTPWPYGEYRTFCPDAASLSKC